MKSQIGSSSKVLPQIVNSQPESKQKKEAIPCASPVAKSVAKIEESMNKFEMRSNFNTIQTGFANVRPMQPLREIVVSQNSTNKKPDCSFIEKFGFTDFDDMGMTLGRRGSSPLLKGLNTSVSGMDLRQPELTHSPLKTHTRNRSPITSPTNQSRATQPNPNFTSKDYTLPACFHREHVRPPIPRFEQREQSENREGTENNRRGASRVEIPRGASAARDCSARRDCQDGRDEVDEEFDRVPDVVDMLDRMVMREQEEKRECSPQKEFERTKYFCNEDFEYSPSKKESYVSQLENFLTNEQDAMNKHSSQVNIAELNQLSASFRQGPAASILRQNNVSHENIEHLSHISHRTGRSAIDQLSAKHDNSIFPQADRNYADQSRALYQDENMPSFPTKQILQPYSFDLISMSKARLTEGANNFQKREEQFAKIKRLLDREERSKSRDRQSKGPPQKKGSYSQIHQKNQAMRQGTRDGVTKAGHLIGNSQSPHKESRSISKDRSHSNIDNSKNSSLDKGHNYYNYKHPREEYHKGTDQDRVGGGRQRGRPIRRNSHVTLQASMNHEEHSLEDNDYHRRHREDRDYHQRHPSKKLQQSRDHKYRYESRHSGEFASRQSGTDGGSSHGYSRYHSVDADSISKMESVQSVKPAVSFDIPLDKPQTHKEYEPKIPEGKTLRDAYYDFQEKKHRAQRLQNSRSSHLNKRHHQGQDYYNDAKHKNSHHNLYKPQPSYGSKEEKIDKSKKQFVDPYAHLFPNSHSSNQYSLGRPVSSKRNNQNMKSRSHSQVSVKPQQPPPQPKEERLDRQPKAWSIDIGNSSQPVNNRIKIINKGDGVRKREEGRRRQEMVREYDRLRRKH